VWPKIVEALASKGYSMGKLKLDRASVDSTTIETRKGGARRIRWVQAWEGVQDTCGRDG
jgi:hypothetical protein